MEGMTKRGYPVTKLILTFTLCTLGGCERWFEQGGEKALIKIERGQKKELVEQGSKARTVFDQWFVGDVAAREVVHFKITAIEQGDQFGEIYSKEIKSFWEVPTYQAGPFPDNGHPVKKEGRCVAYFRDYLGEGGHFINLLQREKWPFKIMVGGIRYPLDNSFRFEETTLYATLSVTKKMLQGGSDLVISIVGQEEKEIRTGFIGYGTECDGRAGQGFKTAASEIYEMIHPLKTKWLEVTTIRKQAREVQTVFKRWFVGNVTASKVQFEIKASEEWPQFEKVYSRKVQSFWKSRKCMGIFSDKKMDCLPWKEYVGRCLAYYREFKGFSKTPIVLLEREIWPFKIIVGGKSYPLDDGFKFREATLYATLTITKKMLQGEMI